MKQNIQEIKDQIKRRFKNHVAKYTEQGDMKRLEWYEPGTRMEGMDIIFHRSFVIICGDLGEATYQCTWKTDLKSCANTNFDYFTGKLSTVRDGKKDWNEDDCITDINEWQQDGIKEIENDIEDYPEGLVDKINKFVEDAKYSTEYKSQWISFLMDYDLESIGEDFETPLYYAGERLNTRLYMYHIVLQMAWEKIKKEE